MMLSISDSVILSKVKVLFAGGLVAEDFHVSEEVVAFDLGFLEGGSSFLGDKLCGGMLMLPKNAVAWGVRARRVTSDVQRWRCMLRKRRNEVDNTIENQ